MESTFKLDKIVLQRPELFMCLLSALLGISSGEIVSKDSMLQLSLICKACNFLKASSAALQKANPSSFQFRMILRYAFVSLMELLNYTSIEYIIENPAFIEFLATGTELAENLSGEEWKVSNTFWKVESIIEVVQAVWSMLSWGLSMKAQFSDDITELMRKFIDCGIIQLTRNAGDIVSKLMHLLEEVTTGTTDFEFAPVISKDSREQLCSQHLDGLNSLLVKLIKKYRRVRKGRACILSVCTDVQRLGKRKQRTSGRKSHGNKPNSSTTESEKESQDVENLSSQSSSTEDMSDYIMKLSDSEEEKPKRERAKLELTITKPKPGM